MHVMHILGGFGPGGAEMGVVRLIKAMNHPEIQHSVCSISSELGMKSYLPSSVQCHSLGLDGPNRLAFKTMAKLFKATDVDIAHVNNIAPWFDVAMASKISGSRCIQTFHGVEDRTIQFSWLKKQMLYAAWKCTDHLTAVSDAAADLFSELTGIGRSHVYVINNGVDTRFFSPAAGERKNGLKRKLGFPETAVVTGCVAALRPVKNHKGLLAAFRTVVNINENAILVFVGDGPLRQDLETQARSMHIMEKVIFSGRKDNVDDYLKSFDLFVLNSRTEGLSYAILEAMACGLPVVCTDVGGNTQLIGHEKDGFLYPDDDLQSLSGYILRMIDDPGERKVLGENARKKIKKHYSMENMVKSYQTLYQNK